MFQDYLTRHKYFNSFLNGFKDMHSIYQLDRTDDLSRLIGRITAISVYTIDFCQLLATENIIFLTPLGTLASINLWSYRYRLLAYLENRGREELHKKRERIHREIGEY